MRFVEHGRHVEELVLRDPDGRAARDRAHRVPAAAEAREPRSMQPLEHLGQRVEPQVVQLDVLARGQLGLALAAVERELPDRTELGRGQPPRSELDPEHERPDLGLVVVEPPPLEAHDVLLGDVGIAGGDQGRELVEHPERPLLALEALDGVALQHQLHRRGLGLRSCAWNAHPPPRSVPGTSGATTGKAVAVSSHLSAHRPDGGSRLDVAPGRSCLSAAPRLRRRQWARSLGRSR